MKNWKVSFKQLRLEPETGQMLDSLQRGLTHFGIDYYMVGAISRNAWMSGLHNITPRRTTADIDFAVFINDKGVYEELKAYLIEQEGFSAYHENAFVLIWKNRLQVDLLPFGAIEDEQRKVTINGTGYTSVDVPGFKEIYEEPLPEIQVEDHRFKCCTLPGIVLLKLIAWNDRPEARRGDIVDIADILSHFFDMYQEEIYTDHLDLFEHEELELIDMAAIVMGREINKITARDKSLFDRVAQIFEKNTQSVATSRIATIMTEYFENTVEESFKLLLQIKEGYLDSKP